MFNFFFHTQERLPLPYKRELHCHIVPGVDDGSKSLDSSISYLKSLHSFGVERVVLTPHRTDVTFENTPEIIQPIFDELVTAVGNAGLNLEMSYSFEYRLDDGFLQLAKGCKFGEPTCRLRPLYGRHLLIENSFFQPLQCMDEVIYRLQSAGFFLILAHPERYEYYAGHNGRLYEHLQNLQVEFQCNILSFAGYYGPVAQKMAYWMLEKGYVNYMGSDLHNDHHVQLISKFLKSKEYARIYPRLTEMINNDYLG